MSITRTFVHRGICLIFFFVTGFGTLPPYHGVALRTKESGGLRREAEAGPFAVHRDASFPLSPRQGETESQDIVADAESYLHILPLTVDE